MRKESRVQKVRAEGGLTYAEAVRVEGQGTVASGRGARELVVQEVGRQVDDRVWVSKRALVTFIAGVVNSTFGVSSKTAKIQLVVKAAVGHLGVEGLSWEEVQRDLQGVGVSLGVRDSQSGGGSLVP